MSDFPPGPYRDAIIRVTAADGSIITIAIPTEVELVRMTETDPKELEGFGPLRQHRPAPFSTTTFTVQQTAKQAEAHSKAGGESIYTVSWRRPSP